MNTGNFFNRVYINKGEVIVTDTEEKGNRSSRVRERQESGYPRLFRKRL